MLYRLDEPYDLPDKAFRARDQKFKLIRAEEGVVEMVESFLAPDT